MPKWDYTVGLLFFPVFFCSFKQSLRVLSSQGFVRVSFSCDCIIDPSIYIGCSLFLLPLLHTFFNLFIASNRFLSMSISMMMVLVVLSLLLHSGSSLNKLNGRASLFTRPKAVLTEKAPLFPRPKDVNLGAIFSLDSTIGKVSKIAIEQAIKDVNSNSRVLNGTKLHLAIKDSNCSGFLGLVEALQYMETDVVAVMGPQSSVVAHMVLHVANELQTPFLSFAATDPTLASLQFPYFIRTTHSDLQQMTAVAEIIDHYGWKDVIVIFLDDDYGRNGLTALDNALSANRYKVSFKAAIPPTDEFTHNDIMDILVKISMMESRVIVLHTYPEVGLSVFKAARFLGMMSDGYVWIATDWLSSSLDSALGFRSDATTDIMQGVLVLRHYTPESHKKRAFVKRWDKMAGHSIGLNSYGLYAYDTVWLLAHAIDSFLNQGGVISFTNETKLQSLIGSSLHLDAMSIFNGGPLLLKNILKTDFVGVTGPVKFNLDKSLVFPAYEVINVIGTGLHRVGYWSNYSGLSTVEPRRLYTLPANRSIERQKLNSVVWPGETVKTPRGWVFPSTGKMLKIGVPRRVSFQEFVGYNASKGLCIDVFTAAVNLLPYAVPYQLVPYGNGLQSPSYNELVRMITTGVFDGVVGDVAIVTNRTRIVDFTQPYVSSGLVVVASLKKSNTGAWAFLNPFSPELWCMTAGFIVIVSVVIWVSEHRVNDEFRGSPKDQMITSLWFTLSTLFFSHKETTKSTLGRGVLVVWLFVILIIISSYTASLTSILTVQQLYSPLKGIESLKEGNDPVGYQVGSFAEHYLTEGIGIPKSRLRPLTTPEEYAKALKKGPQNGGVAAVVDERPYIDLFLAIEECKFKIIGQEFTRSGWGFAFPQDSPLAVDLSTAILTLSENGDLQRINDKWLTKTGCSKENTELNKGQLHLESFWGLYLLSGIACGVALLISFYHMFRRYWRSVPDPSAPDGSNRIENLESVIDDKKDISEQARRRRQPISSDLEMELDSNGREMQVL